MPGPVDLVETYVSPETLEARLAQWLERTAPYRWRREIPIRAETSALLVVDMTRAFVDPDRPLSSPNARVILPRVAELVTAFRQRGRPVIWLVQGHHCVAYDRGELLSDWWPVPILEGTPDVEPAEGLSVLPQEKVILKRRYSGFYQTDLELTLRCLKVEAVVVCGVLTNVCPFATAFDAFHRGFRVYVPADGTASLNEALHVGALCTLAGWAATVTGGGTIGRWLSGGG